MHDQHVDVFGVIADLSFSIYVVHHVHVISAFVEHRGGLQLDAPEAGSRIYDEVISIAVAPGLGDQKSLALPERLDGNVGTVGMFPNFRLTRQRRSVWNRDSLA